MFAMMTEIHRRVLGIDLYNTQIDLARGNTMTMTDTPKYEDIQFVGSCVYVNVFIEEEEVSTEEVVDFDAVAKIEKYNY